MISSYIECPKLLYECQLLTEPNIEKYIAYLETRRYSDKTITSYISSVVHYFSWRRKINKNASTKITDKFIYSFISRHLKACKCPSSFYRVRASCAASLHLWRRVIGVDYPSIETEENRLLNQYEEYLKSVVGLASTSRQARCRYSHEFITWLKKHLSKNVSELSLQGLATYVYQRSSNLAPGSVTTMVSALGYFVRYLSLNKHCSISLPVYIPRTS